MRMLQDMEEERDQVVVEMLMNMKVGAQVEVMEVVEEDASQAYSLHMPMIQPIYLQKWEVVVEILQQEMGEGEEVILKFLVLILVHLNKFKHREVLPKIWDKDLK